MSSAVNGFTCEIKTITFSFSHNITTVNFYSSSDKGPKIRQRFKKKKFSKFLSK